MQRVGDDTDNFITSFTTRSNVEMLAQRIFAEEVLLRQLLADDNGLRMAGSVLASKEAPVQERYLQCAEVSGVGQSGQRVGQRRAGRGLWMLGNREGVVTGGSCSRHDRPQPCRTHTRHSAYLVQQVLVECVHLLGAVVFLGGQAVAHREHVVRGTAHISRPQSPETLEEKSGGD